MVFFLGLGLLWGGIQFLPDGKLHLVFCDVGQGDAIYIRFPNQADMLVDGGPGRKVLDCLGKYMPFYDRTIDLIILTHPQKDHLGGLVYVLQRYKVKYFNTVPIKTEIKVYQQLRDILETNNIPVKFIDSKDQINFGEVNLDILWPEESWMLTALGIDNRASLANLDPNQDWGVFTSQDLNMFSIYIQLNWHNFNLLLTGDGDEQVQDLMKRTGIWETLPNRIEVLKVPHHGSRTGMTPDFIQQIAPQLSVIQVGKNSYGHPSQEIIDQLSVWGKVLRTDKQGDIEVVTDGLSWQVKK